jgi:surface polysaccharide O-acyltransferase-like enzyme
MHWLGQSGWLNWFGLPNPSPFGSGLWFFTLLLLFYLFYPVMARVNENVVVARVSLVVVAVLTMVLNYTVEVGHALWITVFAFWFGSYVGRHPVSGSAIVWLGFGLFFMLSLVLAHAAELNGLNIFFIAGSSISLVLWLERVELPQRFLSWLLWLSPCVLEIYLIHTYLFVKWDLPLPVRFLTSLVGIITCAKVLAWAAGQLQRDTRNARAAHS